MSKINQTVSEVQLKGRRTSLGKKSVEELITIILRKDKTERNMNSKIQQLTALLDEADSLNDEKANRISNFDKDMQGMEEKISVKQEVIDNLMSEKHSLTENVDNLLARIERKNYLLNYRRKVILFSFGLNVILIMLLILSIIL